MEKKGGYVPSVIISIMIPETSAIDVIPQDDSNSIQNIMDNTVIIEEVK